MYNTLYKCVLDYMMQETFDFTTFYVKSGQGLCCIHHKLKFIFPGLYQSTHILRIISKDLKSEVLRQLTWYSDYAKGWITYKPAQVKGKIHPRTVHEDPEQEQTYSVTLSLTSALDGGGWSTPRPGRFTPGKETRYPLYRRLGRHQGRSEWMRKISPPPGFNPRNVQPITSRYTDCAIPAHPASYIMGTRNAIPTNKAPLARSSPHTSI